MLIIKLIEDKKTSLNIDLLDIIYEIFENFIKNKDEVLLPKEYVHIINDRIINKIIFKLNDLMKKIRKSLIILYFLSYFTFSLLSKIDIIQNIIENYDKIISKSIPSGENFPKKLYSDYFKFIFFKK